MTQDTSELVAARREAVPPPSDGVPAGPPAPRGHALESLAALVACVVAAIAISWRLLRPEILSADALVHQYWMWQYKDPALFTDPLTAELRESARYPEGYELLFRIATEIADPISFGEWLGIGLMAVSGWLIFLIVREQASWRPAAWIAAALFLVLIDLHRFHGGFPRAFVHPVVLLTVLLAIKQKHLAAALAVAGGALFYPPASLLALGVLALSAVDWGGRRLDLRRTGYAVLAGVLAGIAVLGPRLVEGAAPRVLTRGEAKGFPEFSGDGPLHFFVKDTLAFLSQNRSGFDLRVSGSILLLAALGLLLVRRANWRLLRREVLAIPVVCLVAFAVAHAVLFKLYLPHRYTYPLVAFFAIVIGVLLYPTWTAVWSRPRPSPRVFALLCAPALVVGAALFVFPLAPRLPLERLGSATTLAAAAGALVLAAAVTLLLLRVPRARRPALGALLTGLSLLAALWIIPDRGARGSMCREFPATRYLAGLPKDVIVAGDPIDMLCVPFTARRAVVISTQLSPAYEADYFRQGRSRMFRTLRAYYGPSVGPIVALNREYGATHLWVRSAQIRIEMNAPRGARWRRWEKPYGAYVRGMLALGEPATLSLPAACRTWRQGSDAVYDIRCLGRRADGAA